MHALTLWTAMLACTAVRDTPSPRAIVNKAIEAHGGAANLKRYQAVKYASTSKVYREDRVEQYVAKVADQWPDRAWFSIVSGEGARKLHIVAVVNGAGGWVTVNGKKQQDKEPLSEEREVLHADWIASLRALLDQSIPIAAAGETRIDGRPAVGVIVTHQGHRLVRLFFDKATGLLLKSETVAKDLESHKELSYEQFYSNYRTIQGIKFAMQTRVLQNGKLSSEHEKSEVTLLERLDDRLFAEP